MDFAVTEMDFDELRATDGLAIIILERRHDLVRLDVNHVRRVAPGEAPVEAESHPAMAAGAEVHLSQFLRRHFRGVEIKQLLPILVADPKFLLVRRETRAVRAMR